MLPFKKERGQIKQGLGVKSLFHLHHSRFFVLPCCAHPSPSEIQWKDQVRIQVSSLTLAV